MDEELMKCYQETITLLQFRNPGYTFHGEFRGSEDGKTAFRLFYYKELDSNGEWSARTQGEKIYKYMPTAEKALWYFVKTSKNRVF